MKTLFLIFIGRLVTTASTPLEDYSYQPQHIPDYDADYPSLAEQLAEKRGAGKWKMRMFKRDPEEDFEEVSDGGEEVPEEFEDDENLDMSKRGRQWKMRMFKKKDPWKMRMFKKGEPWKMRMFKKGQPWKMRMFKRLPYMLQSEMDKKSPWKMRMFKRLPMGRSYGKRPDKWQMRMFKRDPELGQETAGDSLR